jgi:NADPH:quinone reductase-like Zn-dependent oxidoreductase
MGVVFDAVGGETLRRSWSVLKPNGRMVTIAAAGDATGDERTNAAFFIVEPDGPQLVEIGRPARCGRTSTGCWRVGALFEAAKAFAGTIERKGRGKL